MKTLLPLLLVLTLAGCAGLPERPCSPRDKQLLQFWYALKVGSPNAEPGRQEADRFIMAAIEQEVPLHCWRDR